MSFWFWFLAHGDEVGVWLGALAAAATFGVVLSLPPAREKSPR